MINKLKSGGKIKLIIILGLAGMLLILFSEIFSDNENETEKINSMEEDSNFENYAEDMEKQLENILEKIDGVGKTKVMITVESTEEYIYAQQEKTKQGENDISNENEYVIIGSGSEKEALLKKIVSPKISGVVIICEGGDSNIVKEKVYNTVSAVFNISSQRIFVAKSID